jgi:hypothetical protein
MFYLKFVKDKKSLDGSLLAWVEKGDKSGVTGALVERAKRVLEVYG